MSDCCSNKSCDLEAVAKRQESTLWVVLWINATMFLVETVGAVMAGSLALTGDSVDMLGDAIAYGTSIFVVRRGLRAKARSALFKSGIIGVMALFVLGSAVYRTAFREAPEAGLMGGIGTLALVANSFCLYLLTRHRNDDVNMASVWECSRNDIVANVSVLAAAGLVQWTRTPWPDLAVGLGLSVLFARSAFSILRNARTALASAVAVGNESVSPAETF